MRCNCEQTYLQRVQSLHPELWIFATSFQHAESILGQHFIVGHIVVGGRLLQFGQPIVDEFPEYGIRSLQIVLQVYVWVLLLLRPNEMHRRKGNETNAFEENEN